ncbi:SDR family NAD(P)-dependent oxidoreductase [Arthrobacter sp. MDT3-24]
MSDTRFALVTGAAGGIGLGVGARLAQRGLTVIAVERNLELAERATAAIGASSIAVACDLSDRSSVAELSDRIEHEWGGRLDVVVFNAGVIIPGDAADTSTPDLEFQLEIMLLSVLALANVTARVFRAKNQGHILATVSMGGILAMPGSAAYAAAKAGLRAYLASLKAELRGTAVAVSGIYPSAVDTPMLYHEATHDGSLLNFVGRVSHIDEVVNMFDLVLRSKRLEIYLPYSDSILSRFLQCFPWILPRILGPLESMGRRGRSKYLATKRIGASA